MNFGYRINKQPFYVPLKGRHLYIIGMTGAGKSTLQKNLIQQKIDADECVVVIDPHGDLSEDVCALVPQSRTHDLIYFKPSDLQSPVPFNPLHGIAKDDHSKVAEQIVSAFVEIYGGQAVGDRSQEVLRNSILAVLETPNPSLLVVVKLLNDPDFLVKITANLSNPMARNYWSRRFASYDEKRRMEVTDPIQNKLDAMLSHPAFINALSQNGTISLTRAIEDKKIIVLNLSDLGESAFLFGALFITTLWATVKTGERKPCSLFIDEFQHFTTKSIAAILSEARKFNLELFISHQYWGQVDEATRKAVFGNVGTLVSFRIGADDTPLVAKHFEKPEKVLLDLQDHMAYIRPLPPSDAQLITTLTPPLPLRKPVATISASNHEFAAKRNDVEADIRRLLS